LDATLTNSGIGIFLFPPTLIPRRSANIRILFSRL
jgi:hypothetical protein